MPIYLIRTDIYGEPTDTHDDREVSKNVKEFWANRDNPVSGRIEQERNALLKEVNSFFETGEVGGRITKYLGDYEGKLRFLTCFVANGITPLLSRWMRNSSFAI